MTLNQLIERLLTYKEVVGGDTPVVVDSYTGDGETLVEAAVDLLWVRKDGRCWEIHPKSNNTQVVRISQCRY